MYNEFAVTDENYMDAARGLYWYCTHYHGGQDSELYSIVSARLEYTPGMGEDPPSGDDESGEDILAFEFYSALERGDVDATELCEAIHRAYLMGEQV